jgi:hypothetical protein
MSLMLEFPDIGKGKAKEIVPKYVCRIKDSILSCRVGQTVYTEAEGDQVSRPWPNLTLDAAMRLAKKLVLADLHDGDIVVVQQRFLDDNVGWWFDSFHKLAEYCDRIKLAAEMASQKGLVEMREWLSINFSEEPWRIGYLRICLADEDRGTIRRTVRGVKLHFVRLSSGGQKFVFEIQWSDRPGVILPEELVYDFCTNLRVAQAQRNQSSSAHGLVSCDKDGE